MTTKLTKRDLAIYYFHNDYPLDVAYNEIALRFKDITMDWLTEVYDNEEAKENYDFGDVPF